MSAFSVINSLIPPCTQEPSAE
uniref:Uncharacterized protein n=1 Tax=Anguilla anguilla TaxID=7936 RepID=A0A0E9TGE1_ANGAN